MGDRFVSLRVILAVFVFLPALDFSSPFTVLGGEPEWVEVRSPNFSVVTDAGEKRGRDVAMRFELMRAVFATLLAHAKVTLPVPLQIVAFRSTKEMRQVAPVFRGKPTQLAGLFQAGGDRSFIMLDMSAENPWTVVFHEYAHQLMNANLQESFDPWFEEGFAEYFSSIEVEGKQAQVGKVPHEDYLILQQVGMMKVADLFKVQHYSETYNENGNNRTIFYSQSGMLVHYIYDHKLLPRVAVYFDSKYNKHASVEDAMQQAFALSPAQFDKALRDYVQSGRYWYYAIPAPANISEKTYTSRSITKADADATIADIHLHSPDHRGQAVGEFQDVLKSDPNNAAACRGLGYAYMEKQDYSQAAEYFKRASQMDSKDSRVHYYNALLMARESGFSDRADLEELTREVETSISLDPNFADSYALLAFAQTTSRNPAKALESMGKAIALDPRNEDYRFNLANIYVANRQLDEAIRVLQSLHNASSPEMVSRAESALMNLRHVQDMASHGDTVTLVQRESPESAQPPKAATSPASSAIKWGPPIFLRGTLSNIDCSVDPAALLTVTSGSKAVRLKIVDKAHVILMGADQFSCEWKNKKIAVNYRESDSGDTNVISLEIQ